MENSSESTPVMEPPGIQAQALETDMFLKSCLMFSFVLIMISIVMLISTYYLGTL